MWHEETLASIRAVRQGEDMPAVGYDSDDDPHVLLNKRIKVRRQGFFLRRLYGTVTYQGSCLSQYHMLYHIDACVSVCGPQRTSPLAVN